MMSVHTRPSILRKVMPKNFISTRLPQVQATVKRFQIDFYCDLEGQHSLISFIFLVKSFRTDKMNQTDQSMVNLEFFMFRGHNVLIY